MFGCNPSKTSCNNPTITAVNAGTYITIVYTVAAITTPFLGRLVDKIGKRGVLVFVSMVIFLFTMILIKILPWNIPHSLILLPLLFFGIFYSMYASIFWVNLYLFSLYIY